MVEGRKRGIRCRKGEPVVESGLKSELGHGENVHDASADTTGIKQSCNKCDVRQVIQP